MQELSIKQQMYVRHVVTGGRSAAEAARLAGYSAEYAKRAAQYLGRNAKVKAAIDAARAELRSETGLTAVRYMQELDELLLEARSAKQYTAASSLAQLKGKVAGLLVDRVQLDTRVDISGALLEARKRALPPLCNPQQIVDAQVIDSASTMRLAHSDNQSVTADLEQHSRPAWTVFE